MSKKYRATKRTWIIIAVFLLIIAVIAAAFINVLNKNGEKGIDKDAENPTAAETDGGADDAGDVNEPGESPEFNEETVAADNLSRLSDTAAYETVFYDTPFIPEGGSELDQLVNKIYGVSKDYVPANLKLTKYRATDRAAENQYMVDYAADAMDSMIEAAQAEGYTILVTTAYRSYNYQSVLYNNYVAKDGQAAADKYSARPGTSEHQTGLAADVTSPTVNYKLTSELGNTPEGKWLAEHAHEYGFILRYPENGTDITGYLYEAWHFRYVGVETAGVIYEHGWTLEEYIASKFNL